MDGDSPCLPGRHPDGVDCGLMGALEQGCGVIHMGACCFADESCIVLTRPQCEEQDGSYQGDDSDCDPSPCVPTPVDRTTWGRVRAAFR